jgi:hypothetical protein
MKITHEDKKYGHKLGYAKIGLKGEWSHFSIQDNGKPSRVGPVYTSKMTLLADNQRYASDVWGY